MTVTACRQDIHYVRCRRPRCGSKLATDPESLALVQAIAVRYVNNREAMTEVLARKIVLGGGGNWGLVPMVPNEHVSAADAQVIARWILEQ